jgi:predicted alpha/beta-fold hydrolase
MLPGEPWRGTVVDPRRGAVALSGSLRRPPGARDAVVLVHGLGGSSDSPYLGEAVAALDAAGAATLRLNLRGSDGEGADIYHAGLTDDVAAALDAPELAGFARVMLLGFSLGGHVTLRYATEERVDPRLAAVAAVCSPLDLRLAQQGIDRPGAWPYRRYLLTRLKALYAAVAAVREVPTPLGDVQRARTIREWDRLTVVPRFGFRDPEDYYARASVGPRLAHLRVPSLLVAAAGDPMVRAEAIRAAAELVPGLDLRWVERGGHVGFPAALDLGFPAPPGLGGQLAGWLLREEHATPLRRVAVDGTVA